MTNRQANDITLDCNGLTSIDHSGVRLLAAIQHDLLTHGGSLTIINASP
jgi:anti-anti-sigma regulatory factor